MSWNGETHHREVVSLSKCRVAVRSLEALKYQSRQQPIIDGRSSKKPNREV